MPRWPLASSVPRQRASWPEESFLPRTDHMHASRILPRRVQRRPNRNARTLRYPPSRPQTEFRTCRDRFFPHRNTRVPLVSSRSRTDQMRTSSSQVLEAFLCRYPPKAPSFPSSDDREKFQLAPKHGLRILELAPATDIQIGAPPTSRLDSNCRHRYLWVIDKPGIAYIIEECLDVLSTTLPKHSNLTGGGNACMGGEMWFASDSSLYVSGGSGRYPARDSQQLSEAVKVFEALGYEVMSLGWDDETGAAKRYRE